MLNAGEEDGQFETDARARAAAINCERELPFVTRKKKKKSRIRFSAPSWTMVKGAGTSRDGIGTWDYFGLSVNAELWNEAPRLFPRLPANFNLTRAHTSDILRAPLRCSFQARGMIISRRLLQDSPPSCLMRCRGVWLIWYLCQSVMYSKCELLEIII